MSNAKFKEISKGIEDLILTEEQMSSGQYPQNEVYDIRFDGKVVGPIWQQDIREYLQSSNQFEDGTEIKSYDKEEWVHIFEHPLFQRRRPQLISNQELDTEDTQYHLFMNGQKYGPYTAFEVNSMLEQKEILVTDEVSIDDGASWGPLYHIEEFDRRVLKSNEELPMLPKQNVFNQSKKEVSKKLKHYSDDKTNLIAGLAYIGNLRTGKAKEALSKSHQEEIEKQEEVVVTSESKSFQDYLWQGLFALSAIGLIAVFVTWSNQKPAPKPAITPTRKIDAKKIEPIKLKPIKKIESSNTQTSRPTTINNDAKVNSRPTSFRRSKAFRQASKKKLTNDARKPDSNDDFYYDDNTDPVELDPIRSTLSKETIDPEFREDEFREEEFVDEYEGDVDSIESNQAEEVFNEEVDY